MISIAILPFKNISNNAENEFLCDGMTEEIINALGKIELLKVTSRTSSFFFKNSIATLSEIGEQLQVEIILEGSLQIAQDKLRIRVQLIDLENDSPFWSDSWDRNIQNIFEVQDEISLLIADKLREHLGHLEISEHLVQNKTESTEVYQDLLKGRFHMNKWNGNDTHTAINYFEKALDRDPKLIEAHIGLADSYSFLAVAGFAPREEAWSKANQSIQRALEIDEDHPGLNFMLGHQAFFTQGDYKGAVHFGRKALQANPAFAEAHCLMAFLFTLNGELDKSKEHVLYAKSVDPLNPETLFFEANYLYRAEEFEASLKILDQLLAQNDKNLPAIIIKLYILLHRKQGSAVRALLKEVPEELTASDERLGIECLSYILEDASNYDLIERLEQRAADEGNHHAHSYLFINYAALGRFDEAFHVLELLFTAQSSILLLGFSDPLAKAIRSDSRYEEATRRMYAIDAPLDTNTSIESSPENQGVIEAMKVRLLDYMESEKPYLNPALSLRNLAASCDFHPNKLSWLLNDQMGKNFNELVNHYRIEHFKLLATDPSNAHISLIGLAYESGFNSKTVFNTAFKKAEGITPKQYQKNQA